MITLRAGVPVPLDTAVVIPVERTVILTFETGLGWGIVAEKGPDAVCIVTGSQVRAFGLDGAERSVEVLSDQVTGLAAALETIRV